MTDSEPPKWLQIGGDDMFIRLYEEDERDLYVQLTDEIIRLMAEGTLKDGDELPSIRSLASSLQVNVKTVQASYQKLADEGYIVQRKKARAVVDRSHFDQAAWEAKWRRLLRQFQHECRATGQSEHDTLQRLQRDVQKEENS